MVQMEAPHPLHLDKVQQRLAYQTQLLVHGLHLATALANVVKTYLNLHLVSTAPLFRSKRTEHPRRVQMLEVPMKSSYLQAVFRLVELGKAVEQTFHRKSLWLATIVPHVLQQQTLRAVTLLESCVVRWQSLLRWGL
jgi:hypothetical protein